MQLILNFGLNYLYREFPKQMNKLNYYYLHLLVLIFFCFN